MHDAIQLEELGIPSTVVITEPFQSMVANQARNLGLPGYHNVMVPHPIYAKDDETLRSLARSVVESVRRQLTD